MNIEGIDIKDIEIGEPIEEKEPTYRDGYIRGIYRARNIIDSKQKEIERLNNIISEIETLVINHNCDTGDIYYKYNGRYLKSELKDRILELLELKGSE